ncbi:hypothetical protein QBC37DRAFT_387020 [Rhypophila decipiens]|uniref:CFEM domain-containing protein n=1 Tax=Rhypophila decipiens TaxID=261697 RepID=A0AAN6YB23_9PEZI|nr:hypothetical protein QBC37DRAFT_387020 [Rhypophila decipiens]
MLSPRVFAILAVYFGLATAGPLALRQEQCGGDWECSSIVDTIPQCARPCIADGAVEVGCDADDFVCRCENKDAISALVTNCVLSSCSIDEAISTIGATDSLCTCVGSNGGPQPACPPASSAAPPPPASSAAPPVSSAAPPPASSAPAPPVSSAPAPPSYSAAPVPSASPSSSAPAPPASSAAPVPSCSAAPAPAPAPAPAGPWECQSLVDAVHECAIPCIAEGAASVGCDSDDFTCRCDNAAAISEAATTCVLGACGIATGLEVRQQTADLCTCVAANPPPSGDAPETPAPAPSDGCPPPAGPGSDEPDYPTEPPKDDDDKDEPVTPEPEPTPAPSATSPVAPEPSTPVDDVEPPVVTAGAAKFFGSGAAALLALAVAL